MSRPVCVRRAQSKVIVFLSTCQQVRFAHDAFRKLRPGVPLRALHGEMIGTLLPCSSSQHV